MRKEDVKMIYAQSSDIKARTYLEYRKDMKKKAIVELEIIEWLEITLKKLYKQNLTVKKSGGDKHIWFLRKGGITGEADYIVNFDNSTQESYEFQYSDRNDLEYYDFKVSKIGKKVKNKRVRIPYENKKFIYIIKPSLQYAILTPKWILNNSIIAGVPAWGNRTAYRVPRNIFLPLFKKDNKLKTIIKLIDIKIFFLNYQFTFIADEEKKIANILQSIVDDKKIVKILPNNFESFFQVCFILDKLNKIPENINLWLIYLISYFTEKMTSYEMAKFIFALDFLYSKTILEKNEIKQFTNVVHKIKEYCKNVQTNTGEIKTSYDLSHKNEVKYYLFVINILEDLIQDVKYYYQVDINPINKIFETVKHIEKLYKIIS